MKTPSIHPLIAELKVARKAWKFTLTELEHRAGVGIRTLQHSERGHHSPTLRTLMSWAEALGYEIVLKPK